MGEIRFLLSLLIVFTVELQVGSTDVAISYRKQCEHLETHSDESFRRRINRKGNRYFAQVLRKYRQKTQCSVSRYNKTQYYIIRIISMGCRQDYFSGGEHIFKAFTL